MRICLLSLTYPPTSTEGIPRQRQSLALALSRQGHDVHVVTIGMHDLVRTDCGVTVHEIAITRQWLFSAMHAEIDNFLTVSQALYEGLQRLHTDLPIDIVDVPFWSAQGLVPAIRFTATVIWLQTTTAQLIEFQGRLPTRSEQLLIELEQKSLNYAGGILSDSQAALGAVQHHYVIPTSKPVSVAHLGLPSLDQRPPDRQGVQQVEILVVGRLERRKGTPLLLEILPDLLWRHPQLRVRFVGRDNSMHDGWRQSHGETYIATFARRFPDLRDRVVWDGYISDTQLLERYQQASILLMPSLYESFGLVYLEAMRAGLPIVTFDSGSPTEIFPRCEQDGALIAPIGNSTALYQALERLVQNPQLRHEIGLNGYQRFLEYFTDTAMAQQTIAHYEQVLSANQQARYRARQVYQVMEAIDIGDGVSNITLDHAVRMAQLNQPSVVLAHSAHPQLRQQIQLLQLAIQPETAIIFHYWNYNSSIWLLDALRGPRAVYYHNMTPLAFYPPGSVEYQHIRRGHEQMQRIADSFDLVIGDSRYNVAEFLRCMTRPVPHLHIYPVVQAEHYCSAAYDEAILQQLHQSGDVNIIFVGRIARNKRQDRLMTLFDYYYRYINQSARLWLVGNDQSDPLYTAELLRHRAALTSGERIVLTGKVSDSAMISYFRGANIFVCASEHEGFCIPLVQAMALDVPVMAFAAAGIPETMGAAGVLINEWDVPRIAEMLHLIVSDQRFRDQLIVGQHMNLQRFTAAEALVRLDAAITYLREGIMADCIDLPGGDGNDH